MLLRRSSREAEMPRSVRVNAAICISVAAAGIGVAIAGALLDPKDVDTRPRSSGKCDLGEKAVFLHMRGRHLHCI